MVFPRARGQVFLQSTATLTQSFVLFQFRYWAYLAIAGAIARLQPPLYWSIRSIIIHTMLWVIRLGILAQSGQRFRVAVATSPIIHFSLHSQRTITKALVNFDSVYAQLLAPTIHTTLLQFILILDLKLIQLGQRFRAIVHTSNASNSNSYHQQFRSKSQLNSTALPRDCPHQLMHNYESPTINLNLAIPSSNVEPFSGSNYTSFDMRCQPTLRPILVR